ncbi:MAG: hypothetical protein KGL43_18915 [Burkholderiales bacterium]|nr:hypothetical protein [Burkholderiales bacterium]
MSFNDSSYGLYQGQLFIAERSYNGALLSGFQFLGDVDKFEIAPKQKYEDIMESQSGLGLTAAHIPTETAVSLAIQALDQKMQNWVKATWGGTAGAVVSGTVSAESVVLYNGAMTPLAHPGVTSVVITSTPSLVLGTDYTIDAVNGAITVLASSTAIVSGTPLTVSVAYSYAAYNGRVDAFTTGQRYWTARLHGRNTAQGNQPLIVTVNQVTFDIAKAFSLIEKKHQVFALDGACLQDALLPLPSSPTSLSQFFSIVKA